jgi:hypothetical protein
VLAPVHGFEPRLGESKSPVLPLNETGMVAGVGVEPTENGL